LITLTRGERQTFPGGFVIEADKTPNRRYLTELFGETAVSAGLNPVISALMDGQVQALLVINGTPDFRYPPEFVEGARRCEFVALVDILRTPLSDLAHVVLPGCAWVEKDGTFINVDGRIQRVRKSVEPPGQARPELETLQSILKELQERPQVLSAEGVFKEAFDSGASYQTVGDKGMKR
jgi:formate dehydrogenase major subunit